LANLWEFAWSELFDGSGASADQSFVLETDPARQCWCNPCFPCGDSDGDGFLTFNPDVQILIDNWGGYHPCADFNRDGFITFSGDVQVIIDNWDTGCVGPCTP